MGLDARLEEIFVAWFDYEHAGDEDAKGLAKVHRNKLIEDVLRQNRSDGDVAVFLRAFNEDYRKWVIYSRLKTGRKRF